MSIENGQADRLGGGRSHGPCPGGRLLAAGHDVAVYNRTRAKAESLAARRHDGGRAVGAGGPRGRLHDGRRAGRLQGGRARARRACSAGDGAAPRGDRRHDHRVAGRRRWRSATRRRERGVALIAAPVSGNPKVVEAGRVTIVRVRAARGVRAGRARARAAGAGVTYVGDGEKRAAGEDLPQPDARRRGPVHGRDHRAGGEGRHVARRLPRLPQRQRDGLDVHALQDAGVREPRLHAHVHARCCCARTSTSASRRRASSTCRCRSPPPPQRDRPGADRVRLRRTWTSPRCSSSRRARPGTSSSPRTSQCPTVSSSPRTAPRRHGR